MDTLIKKRRLEKIPGSSGKRLTHPEKRLLSRTRLNLGDLKKLRVRLAGVKNIPQGVHHVPFGLEGYAVVKTVGKNHRPVVASVLARDMRPPGRDLSGLLAKQASRALMFIKVAGIPELIELLRKLKPKPKAYSLEETEASPSVPHNKEFVQKMVGAEDQGLLADTTPLADLLAGRRLPMRTKKK